MNTMNQDCKHPPTRYFSGTYWHPEYGDVLWIGCCDCGELLGERVLKTSNIKESKKDGYRSNIQR